jgi:uncharacterized protein (TIGR02270 family)
VPFVPVLPVLWDVAEEHLDEAEFLFQQWERGLVSSELTFAELRTGWEARLLARIEALIWTGPLASRTLLEPLIADDGAPRDRVAVAALSRLLAEGPSGPEGLATTIARLATATGPACAGLVRALQIAPDTSIDERCREALAAATQAPQVARLLEVAAGRGLDPGSGGDRCLRSDDPAILAPALRAIAASERAGREDLVDFALRSEVAAVRDSALATAVFWDMAAGWRLCRTLAREGYGPALLHLSLGRTTDDSDYALIAHGLGDADSRADRLWALGFTGRPDAARLCVPFVADADESIARLAGEAFVAITGLPWRTTDGVRRDKAEAETDTPASDLSPALQDDDLDADLVPGPLDALPLLNPELVARWWRDNEPRFDPRRRYLGGAPLTPSTLSPALLALPMRRRRWMLLGQALLSRGGWLPTPERLCSDQGRRERLLARHGGLFT